MTDSVKIRHAKPEDAEAILTLKRDAWLATYPNKEHGISPGDIRKVFADDDLAQGIKNWQNALAGEKKGGDRCTFVAEMNGKVVGYTSPCTEDGKRMLGAMYVAPGSQGKGVGGKLISKAIEWFGPKKDIYADVVSYNDNAIKFYEHFGFQKTGVGRPQEIDEKGIKLLPDIEMMLKAN